MSTLIAPSMPLLSTYDAGLIVGPAPDTAGSFIVRRRYTAGGNPGDLPSNVVYAVNEDANGRIWAATSNGLSALVNDSTFSTFTSEHGLSGNQVFSLLRDRKHQL